MYKKYFCTFADSRMRKSLQRIEKQAKDLNFFDKLYINDENSLDENFRNEFKDKLIKGSRGYGYWVWKPQVILQALREMDEGDILLYADTGCHLNKGGIERLKYYFNLAMDSVAGIHAFQECKKSSDEALYFIDGGFEKYFTKGDLFDYFKVIDNAEIYNTGQIAATTFIIKKCEQSEKIVNEWLDVFKFNFNLVDDSPSKINNFDGFIENRHDQSIFSILCKLNGVSTSSAYEIWQDSWDKLFFYPIWAMRDKKVSFYWRLRCKLNFLFNKYKKYGY